MNINFNGLNSPVDRAAKRAFVRKHKEKAFDMSNGTAIAVGVVTMGIGLGITMSMDWSDGGVVAAVFLTVGIIFLLMGLFGRSSTADSVRLSRFAADNEWKYICNILEPEYPGLIFSAIGTSQKAQDVISSEGGESVLPFEIGNYEYSTGGDSKKTYRWVYCRVKLDRHLPHMVLDARSNNMAGIFGSDDVTNLPLWLDQEQVLSLEGDFNNYFTLYAPKEYERDALYIFTPDLMALLVDMAHAFDVEIIDDNLYLYTRGGVATMAEPAFMQRMFAIMQSIGEKLQQRSEYYADEFVADRTANVVAQGGRRLESPRVRIGVAMLIGLGIYIISTVVILMSAFGG